MLRAQTPDFNDLQYAVVPLDAGGTQTLSMDVWLSTSNDPHAPLFIWIHGGAWLAGTYNSPPPGLQSLLNAGYAVASVQYRFSTAAIFPAQIHDVKGAVRFLRSRADDFDLDASRFVAWGSSAGGHLTALLATSGGVAALEGVSGGNLDQSSAIQAAVDYFGPTDILRMNLDITTPPGGFDHDAPSSPESQLIGFDGLGEGIGVLRENLTNPAPPFPEKASLAMLVNPITHIDANDPPMFIAHGDQDATVPLNQSFRLDTALTSVGVEHVMRVVVGAGHGFGTQSTTINEEALNFINAHLLQPDGDFDRDGDVDGRDFLVWQRQFGSNVTIHGSGADADHDGMVTSDDLTVWQQHYGEGIGQTSALSIPEPSAWSLYLIFFLSVALGPALR